MYYILDKYKNPQRVYSWEEYDEWRKKPTESGDCSKRVALANLSNGMRLSTVFLGMNHGGDRDWPILFETLLFDADRKEIGGRRYHTWDEAMQGHLELLADAMSDNPQLTYEARLCRK